MEWIFWCWFGIGGIIGIPILGSVFADSKPLKKLVPSGWSRAALATIAVLLWPLVFVFWLGYGALQLIHYGPALLQSMWEQDDND